MFCQFCILFLRIHIDAWIACDTEKSITDKANELCVFVLLPSCFVSKQYTTDNMQKTALITSNVFIFRTEDRASTRTCGLRGYSSKVRMRIIKKLTK